MRIVINSRTFDLNQGDRNYAERRLSFALGRFSNRVVRVTLTLDDMNGPRGGVDKCARMVIQLSRGEPVAITSEAVAVREAVDLAVDRAKRAVSRRFDRIRMRRNSPATPTLQEFET